VTWWLSCPEALTRIARQGSRPFRDFAWLPLQESWLQGLETNGQCPHDLWTRHKAAGDSLGNAFSVSQKSYLSLRTFLSLWSSLDLFVLIGDPQLGMNKYLLLMMILIYDQTRPSIYMYILLNGGL
jgi:hypothetical protein